MWWSPHPPSHCCPCLTGRKRDITSLCEFPGDDWGSSISWGGGSLLLSVNAGTLMPEKNSDHFTCLKEAPAGMESQCFFVVLDFWNPSRGQRSSVTEPVSFLQPQKKKKKKRGNTNVNLHLWLLNICTLKCVCGGGQREIVFSRSSGGRWWQIHGDSRKMLPPGTGRGWFYAKIQV